MAHLQLTQLSKSYSRQPHALAPTDLSVQPGEFVVLVGPSGCGKSTLLRLIAGLETPTTGSILLDGIDITHALPAARDVAMVFQNYALYPHMTVAENIGFGLLMRRVPATERRQAALEAAELLGLIDLLDRKPGELSGGQRQRVALGRAIVRRPKLFLFDEPLSNLDASLRAATRVELRRLHQQLRATTIYVTHDQTEAMTMGDRLVVLRDGRVQQVGTPLEVYRQPANRFVAGFIGAPPMNLLRATVTGPCIAVAGTVLPWPHTSPRDEVILGLRAEQVRVSSTPRNVPRTLAAAVAVHEALGNETLLTCTLADGQELTARVPAENAPRAGDQVALQLDLARPSLFDPPTGDALPLT